MSKKSFLASQWFQKDIDSVHESTTTSFGQYFTDSVSYPSEKSNLTDHTKSQRSHQRFPKFIYQNKTPKVPQVLGSKFSPIDCFVPGWKGDSLPSMNILKFERLMTKIQLDIKNELLRTKDFPKTIKQGLYNEFLSFAETLGLNFEDLSDLGSFWNALDIDNLNQDHNLSEFINIYSNRVATITFLKLRFIASLIDKCGIELSHKALLYPTAFLSQIFKTGSHTELKSSALETNLYSWYRPHEGMQEAMRELFSVSRELEISEITKHLSHRTQISQDQNKIYSHALSHLSMGLFLNSLQINFPLWIETLEAGSIPNSNVDTEKIISCKYFGDYLESLSLSHWLAQENNIDFRWDELLCPDFKGVEFVSGTFTKICNELQFLTFLAKKSIYRTERPIEYICKIMSGHFRNRKNSPVRQGLLLDDNPFFSSTYDRVVLNLCQFPKNNPQHFLMTQIMEQVKYLKPNGYLFVLSSKKLFVPSLRERLGPLLKELKTEAIFDFENMKGKGELGSYIYIFRKHSTNLSEKQLCSYFRFSAELVNFQQFASVADHLRTFYLANLSEAPAMGHLDFPDTFRVEYFQEAIVNGMLIHSTNEDSTRITHPSYFKSLLSSCVPLDTIFEIRSLHTEDKLPIKNPLNLGLKSDVLYFLVVDFRHEEVRLELHPMDTFRSIYSDYGATLCSYFQLLPKIPGLNPNLLRNYFETPVGKQLMNLTFNGGVQLVKGSLSKFLVPKFLTETEPLPSHIRSGFKILELNEEQLLNSSTQDLQRSFIHIDQILKDLLPRYACEILSLLSNFERTLKTLIWKMNEVKLGQKMSFMSPVVQAKLVMKQTFPIYPQNEDIFIEFVDGSVASDIHLPFTDCQIKVIHKSDLRLSSLEMISENKIILRLHAEDSLLQFIQLLLSEACGVPVSKILRALYVPKISDLKEVIETTKDLRIIYEELLQEVQKTLDHAMRIQVLQGRKQ